MLRSGFDPDRPLVATSAFQDGTVAAGAVWDWRGQGVSQFGALALFQAGLVAHPPPLTDAELDALTAPAPSPKPRPKR